MESAAAWARSLPLADLAAAVVLLAGAAYGLLAGLGRLFGGLLWTLAALWLSAFFTPILLEWMPNTAGTDEPRALVNAYGGCAGFLLVLPLTARLLGGARREDGKKRAERRGGHRVFGAVAGLALGCLLVTFALPFAWRVDTFAERSVDARTPRLATDCAEALAVLFPAEFRAELASLDPGEAP